MIHSPTEGGHRGPAGTGLHSIEFVEGISAGERKRTHMLSEGGGIVNVNRSVSYKLTWLGVRSCQASANL
jgi:hypothetical protein